MLFFFFRFGFINLINPPINYFINPFINLLINLVLYFFISYFLFLAYRLPLRIPRCLFHLPPLPHLTNRRLFRRPLFKLLNPSRRINQLLLSSIKRMACRTNLNTELFLRRPGFKNVPASANNFGVFIILWVDVLFHKHNANLQMHANAANNYL